MQAYVNGTGAIFHKGGTFLDDTDTAHTEGGGGGGWYRYIWGPSVKLTTAFVNSNDRCFQFHLTSFHRGQVEGQIRLPSGPNVNSMRGWGWGEWEGGHKPEGPLPARNPSELSHGRRRPRRAEWSWPLEQGSGQQIKSNQLTAPT